MLFLSRAFSWASFPFWGWVYYHVRSPEFGFFQCSLRWNSGQYSPPQYQVIRTKTSLNSSIYLLSLWLKACSTWPVQKPEECQCPHLSRERWQNSSRNRGANHLHASKWSIIHSTEEFAFLAEYLISETCSQLPIRIYIFELPILSFSSQQSWSSQVPQAAWIAAIQTSHASHSQFWSLFQNKRLPELQRMLQEQGHGFILSMSPLRAVLVTKAAPSTVPLSQAILFLCSTHCKHEVHPCALSQIMSWGLPSPGSAIPAVRAKEEAKPHGSGWGKGADASSSWWNSVQLQAAQGMGPLKVLHSDRAVSYMRCENRSPDLLWSLNTTKTVNCNFPNSLIFCLSIL